MSEANKIGHQPVAILLFGLVVMASGVYRVVSAEGGQTGLVFGLAPLAHLTANNLTIHGVVQLLAIVVRPRKNRQKSGVVRGGHGGGLVRVRIFRQKRARKCRATATDCNWLCRSHWCGPADLAKAGRSWIGH